jgi:uncharacterized membrane protein
VFFAASLTPTLLPRNFLTQGVLSGCSLAAGYGIGGLGSWLWTYMELPQPKVLLRVAKLVTAAGCAVIVTISLWQAAPWQNSIRELMGLKPADTAHPVEIILIALATFAILTGLARFFLLTLRFLSTKINRFLPRRVANVIGVIAAAWLFWLVINGVLFRVALHVVDASFQEYDKLIEPETGPPTDPLKTGSSASLLAWDKLGRAGQEFISSGPRREDISAFSRRTALEPIRVYAGLRSADTAEARAKLALEELKRVGGFQRSVLIVVTPTGTGWVDPTALNICTTVTSRALCCNILILRVGCPCLWNPTTASTPPAPSSKRSTHTGSHFPRTAGRNSICTASALAPRTPNSQRT